MREPSRQVQARYVVNDMKPNLTVVVRDQDGVLVNLTGLTVALYVYGPLSSSSPTVKVNYVAMTLTNPTVGEAQYAWAAGNLDTAGMYLCRVRLGATSAAYEHLAEFYIEVRAASEHTEEAN